MGFWKGLLIIIIVIVTFAYFMPNAYVTSKNFVFDKIGGIFSGKIEEKLTYTNETWGKDYGKIFGFKECENDTECQEYFNIEDMQCSTNGTCFVEGTQ